MKEKANRQAWIGTTPFLPDEKKIAVIFDDMIETFLYGFDGTQDENKVYISTDQVTLGDWTLPPGGTHYEPAGYHLFGDECYYVANGRGVALNPETGETFLLEEGDALYIPKATRHQVYNCSDEPFTAVFTVAPKIWDSEGMGTMIPPVKKPRLMDAYYSREKAPEYHRIAVPDRIPGVDALGHWPAEIGTLRENKQLIRITPKDYLPIIHGGENQIIYEFLVSGDYMHLAIVTVPKGVYSQTIRHRGDMAISVMKGNLTVKPAGSGVPADDATCKCYHVPEGRKCLVPGGNEVQFINFSDQTVKLFVAIAPGL